MPLYEFICVSCGHAFEEISAAGAEAPACPACGASGAARQISMPAPTKKNPFPYPPTGKVQPLGASGMAQGCGGSCGMN